MNRDDPIYTEREGMLYRHEAKRNVELFRSERHAVAFLDCIHCQSCPAARDCEHDNGSAFYVHSSDALCTNWKRKWLQKKVTKRTMGYLASRGDLDG